MQSNFVHIENESRIKEVIYGFPALPGREIYYFKAGVFFTPIIGVLHDAIANEIFDNVAGLELLDLGEELQ